jgi:intracellular multiplication protein IcmJ
MEYVFEKERNMLELILSASKQSWEAKAVHGTSETDPVIHQQISAKYKHTCQYCGWVDKKFNEVSHIDENHHNMNEHNLTLACPLCHQCQHLGQVAQAEGGQMIWAPEISQIEIHHLSRMAWILELKRDEEEPPAMLQAARALCSRLSQQSNVLEANYVTDASDPSFWAEVLMRLPKEKYDSRKELLKNIRVWPSIRRFKKNLVHWGNQVEINLPVSRWEGLAALAIEHAPNLESESQEPTGENEQHDGETE